MTFFHKIKRIFQFLNIQLVIFVQRDFPYTVIAYSNEYQPLFLNKIALKIEKLKKRGCKVRVLITMSEKAFLSHSLENQILLKKLKNMPQDNN